MSISATNLQYRNYNNNLMQYHNILHGSNNNNIVQRNNENFDMDFTVVNEVNNQTDNHNIANNILQNQLKNNIMVWFDLTARMCKN